MIVTQSEVVDISATNHSFTLKTTAIKNNTATDGTIVATLRFDGAARPWFVRAGDYLLGDFVSVTKAGSTLTAANAMIGVSDRV